MLTFKVTNIKKNVLNKYNLENFVVLRHTA